MADESWPLVRTGLTKAGEEADVLITKAKKEGQPLIIMLPGQIYGPGGQFLKMYEMMKNGRSGVFGRGDNHIPRVHVDDCARAFVLAVEKQPVGESFIISDDTPCTTREFRAGARIGMLCEKSAAFYAAYFGALRAGCTVVPYNPRAGAEAIHHVCRDAGLELLICDGASPAGVPDGPEVVRTDSATFHEWLALEVDAPPSPAGDAPAIVLYTSGSTGRPKGVMLSHVSQIAIVDGLVQPSVRGFFGRGPCIIAAPLFHMNGLVFPEIAFAVGGCAVLMRRFEAKAFIAALARYRVTVLSGVPTMVALLAQEREALASADLSSLELVMIGSAPLSDSVLTQARGRPAWALA